jgi:hypothetical protein
LVTIKMMLKKTPIEMDGSKSICAKWHFGQVG